MQSIDGLLLVESTQLKPGKGELETTLDLVLVSLAGLKNNLVKSQGD